MREWNKKGLEINKTTEQTKQNIIFKKKETKKKEKLKNEMYRNTSMQDFIKQIRWNKYQEFKIFQNQSVKIKAK